MKQKILVVDGDPEDLKLLTSILQNDYDLIFAENGKEALEKIKQKPDVILLDLDLPDMDGHEVCKRLKSNKKNQDTPIVFITSQEEEQEAAKSLAMGSIDYISKPFDPAILQRRIKNQIEFKNQHDQLEKLVQQRTAQLSEKVEALGKTENALREAMQNLLTIRVAPGVFWLQVPEAGLYILCGCPGEVVKHLRRQGFIKTVDKNGVTCETGPNVILLSDFLVQNGGFANLAEFPVLQMLYLQGMGIPNHPNNTGAKPMLIGTSAQVQAQMNYIYRGQYGLVSKEEIMACGVDEATADIWMRIKLKFAFGKIGTPDASLDTLEIGDKTVEIRNGVTVCRVGSNKYQFSFRGESTTIDLNLPPNIIYEPPYELGNYRFKRQYFAILHRGEGDGWDQNRPSMGSIVMFQGQIYLVDAGPGILQTMVALGIDISEVTGIFHTHGHDDHFAGLPALIHSDHRLKYFATPPVRAAVTKKFAELISIEEDKFGQFFEICDLKFNVWNDCDGLEVMPMYSPHPTETNILTFRALDKDGYKSYSHWSDLSSFKVMDGMVGDGPNDVPAEFIEQIKKDYKIPADLKKLDIGGGMIHGVASDYRDDPSKRLVLAHIDRKLTTEEMEIGSDTSFGAIDVLIAGDHNYLFQRAFNCLSSFFPGVEDGQIRILLNCPVVEYNAGTIIYKYGCQTDHVDMILAGTVVYLDSESGVSNHLALGSLIGESNLFNKEETLNGTYRAYSHCSVISFSIPLLKNFLEKNNLITDMRATLDKIWFLRKTWLFGEKTTFLSLGNIAKAMKQITMPANSEITVSNEMGLWLVETGEVNIYNKQGRVLEVVKSGGFFGEHSYLSSSNISWSFKTAQATKLYVLHLDDLTEIPIVHWKMLEIFAKRKKISPHVST
ncbi:MAG: response regulator [Magnetococcales bacterium]|nr:response regulator [Magnetococcales bacterium]